VNICNLNSPNPILGQGSHPLGNCALATHCRLIRGQPNYVVDTETKDGNRVAGELAFEPMLLDRHDRLLDVI